MAYILHGALGGLMDVSFWYHFAILFEALFILTAVDAGTVRRALCCRICWGDLPEPETYRFTPANLLATALCVLAWGYFPHQGVVDPLGGLTPCGRCSVSPTRCWRAWPDALRGSAVQDEAPALRMGGAGANGVAADLYPDRGLAESLQPGQQGGLPAIANKFRAMIDSGKIPAQYTESQLSQLVFNNRLDAGLTIFFMVVVVVLALYSLKTALAALKVDKPTAKETPFEPMPENRTRLSPERGETLPNPPSPSPRRGEVPSPLGRGSGEGNTNEKLIMFDTFPKQVNTAAAKMMIGVPDYDNYVEHMRVNHPDQTPMTYEEFFRDRRRPLRWQGRGEVLLTLFR